MKLSISEILELVDGAPTKASKKQTLLDYASPQLITILRHFFDPTVKFLLPEKIDYEECDLPDQEGVLYTNCRILYLFVERGHPNLSQRRREELFKQFLSGLAPADARLMLALKDKKMPYASINRKLVKEAFPDIFSKPLYPKEK